MKRRGVMFFFVSFKSYIELLIPRTHSLYTLYEYVSSLSRSPSMPSMMEIRKESAPLYVLRREDHRKRDCEKR